MPAVSNFAFSPFLAAYSMLDFTMSPAWEARGPGVYCLTTPSMLTTATKHFDRAGTV